MGGRAGRRFAIALLFGAMTAVAAAVVARPRRPVPPLPSAGHGALGRWPAVLAGAGLAWRGPRSVGGIRTAATVVGLGLAVMAIVATVTFQASLQRLVDTPARYALTSDLTIVDAREPDVAELVADRRVAALDLVITVPVTFGDDTAPLQLLSVEHRKGALPVETVAGRPAAALGEIALQPRTAHRLGVGVGDTVAVRPVKGPPVSLRVTGIVVYRGGADDPLGEGGVVVPQASCRRSRSARSRTSTPTCSPRPAGPISCSASCRRGWRCTAPRPRPRSATCATC